MGNYASRSISTIFHKSELVQQPEKDLWKTCPEEVLAEIFVFLELEDRKNVRCTCRRFRQACNSPKIADKEIFFFHPFNTHKRLGRYKSELKRGTMRKHCEFLGLDLTKQCPEEFWRKHGDTFQSLSFHNCHDDGSAFKSIVIHCRNLTSLKFMCGVCGEVEFDRNPTKCGLRGKYFNFWPENILDELLKNRETIEQKNLTVFKIHGYKIDRFSEDRIWRKIFQIYPCIRNFAALIQEEVIRDFYINDNTTENIGNRHPFEEWVFPPSIEIFSSNRNLIQNWRIPDGFKFKELTLTHSYNPFVKNTSYDTVLRFLSTQTELETLRLCIWIEKTHCFALLSLHFMELFDVLRNLPKLKNVELVMGPYVSISMIFTMVKFDEFLDWVCSLESLKLANISLAFRGLSDSDTSNVSVSQPFLPQRKTNLKKLSLDFPLHFTDEIDTEKFAFEILEQCCDKSLEDLELKRGYWFSDRILNKIQTFSALRKLEAYAFNNDECKDITLVNLLHLRHLSLRYPTLRLNPNVFVDLFSKSSTGLSENLRTLYITFASACHYEINEEMWMTTLEAISKSLPRLEVLCLNSKQNKIKGKPDFEWSRIKLPKYCKRLTRLEFLTIWCNNIPVEKRVPKNIIRDLFNRCPSLRFVDCSSISDEQWNPNRSYTYNRSKGRLVRLSVVEAAYFWRRLKIRNSNIDLCV